MKLEEDKLGEATELLLEAWRLCHEAQYTRLEAQVFHRLGEVPPRSSGAVSGIIRKQIDSDSQLAVVGEPRARKGTQLLGELLPLFLHAGSYLPDLFQPARRNRIDKLTPLIPLH